MEAKQYSEVIKAIQDDKAEFVGAGEWEKNAQYQVYKYQGKFYAVIVADQTNCWVMEDTLAKIPEADINKYI